MHGTAVPVSPFLRLVPASLFLSASSLQPVLQEHDSVLFSSTSRAGSYDVLDTEMFFDLDYAFVRKLYQWRNAEVISTPLSLTGVIASRENLGLWSLDFGIFSFIIIRETAKYPRISAIQITVSAIPRCHLWGLRL